MGRIMRKANVFFNHLLAGILEEIEKGKSYHFYYLENYKGFPISLTMPVEEKHYYFQSFPPFFDGLLPEGFLLEGLLRELKLDRNDNFSQLMAVGKDMVGAVTIEEIHE